MFVDTDSAEDKLEIHRCTSMPVKPKLLKMKPLARSPEKEAVDDNDVDYYPESPSFVCRRKSNSAVNQLETRSEQNFSYMHDWTRSTIELSPHAGGTITDSDDLRRSMHRVMEKNGYENVIFRRIPEKSCEYISDFVTTLVKPLLRLLPMRWLNEAQPAKTVERSEIYIITSSIQRKLDELANEPSRNSGNIKSKTNDRVTFSI